MNFNTIKIITLSFLILTYLPSFAKDYVKYELSPDGGVSSITINGDTTKMDWIVKADNSQYPWIGQEYQWGLGRLKINGKPYSWTKANDVSEGIATFSIGDNVLLKVTRKTDNEDLVECYDFVNTGNNDVQLEDIEINTPFNDNYPSAEECIHGRCHAHIWPAGTAAYVNCIRMGAYGPHLGLMLQSGALEGYSIRERNSKKGSSNTRGIISLMPQNTTLKKGEEYSISWRIFPHKGLEDFHAQFLNRGGLKVEADKYVAEVADTVTITLKTKKNSKTLKTIIDNIGDIRRYINWNGGQTFVELFGVSNFNELIKQRASFILKNQTYHNVNDKRHGAFLPYDNVKDSIYINWQKPKNWSDCNEGRERIGMGLFLAYLAKNTTDNYLKTDIEKALSDYIHFVRNSLQDKDFKTWSDADKESSRIGSKGQRERIYNYPWIAHLYFQMFELTNNPEYLKWGYQTMMSCYRYGGYNFYAIDVPVKQSIYLLRENGMTNYADSLLIEYGKTANMYIKNGLNYPKSEVNFEQSIVAPAANFLCEMYLVTADQKYLDAVNMFMPVVEAFGGSQPSSHLNDIGIRHWDGYWFGLPRQWGDTMPHYWSCITADCFENYALCTGNESYKKRAENILKGNLSLFTEDGRGGAAYIYPDIIDDVKAKGLNPMANDQDFALMYYLKWLKL